MGSFYTFSIKCNSYNLRLARPLILRQLNVRNLRNLWFKGQKVSHKGKGDNDRETNK